MREVLVLCEGHTEREFCRSVLAEYVANNYGIALSGTLVGKPQRKHGGIRDWSVYREELLRLAKVRADRVVGVLVDYYAMPHSWPGRSEAANQPCTQRGEYIERRLRDDLQPELGTRFGPCVQLHEFESLLFVDPDTTALSIGTSSTWLSKIKADFGGNVEEIDDSPETAPSERIVGVFPGYDKVAWGVTAVKDVGLDTLRAGCPWLDRWLQRLSSLAGSAVRNEPTRTA